MTRFAEAARALAGLSGVLFGWRPEEFWRATPDELAALLIAARGGGDEAVPIGRARLDALQEAFPDG